MSNWSRRRRLPWSATGLGLTLATAAAACSMGPERVHEADHDGARGGAHAMVAAAREALPKERARFNGKFKLCPLDQRETVREEVDRFVSKHLGSKTVKAKKARSRLEKYTTSPYLPDRFELVVADSDRHAIIMDVERGKWIVAAPSNGDWVKHPDWEDAPLQVSFGIYFDDRDGGKVKMVQQFRKSRGTRLNVSHIDDAGNLRLTAILESKLLPEPFVYEITYCRESPS